MGINYKFSEIGFNQNLIFTSSFFKKSNYLRKNTWFLGINLSHYFEIISGFAFKSQDYCEDGVSVLRIGDISKDGSISIDDMVKVPDSYETKYDRFLIKENDILIAMTGATIGKTAIFKNIDIPILLNQRVGLLRLKDGIDANVDFLVFLLKNYLFQLQVDINSMGKSQPNISPTDILTLKIPNIHITVQNEIYARIEPIKSEIEELKNNSLDKLGIINQVFSDVFEFNSNYYKDFGKGMTAGTQQSNTKEKSTYSVSLSKINNSVIVRISSRFHNPKMQFLNERLRSKALIKLKVILTEKAHRGASPKYDLDGEIPIIKTAHLKNGIIDISEDEFVNEEFYNKNTRSQVFENDILIASTGKVSLGKIDIVTSDIDLVIDGHITVLRVNTKLYNPLFLTYFLRSILGAFQIERDFTGATNQIELYSSEIENFDIPDFTLEQQAEIVEAIKSQLDEQKEINRQIEEKQQAIYKIIEDAIKQEQY